MTVGLPPARTHPDQGTVGGPKQVFPSAVIANGALAGREQVISTEGPLHTPSIAFRHLPPNSARFGYATEETLFISVQLSSDAVNALRKVRVLI